MEWIIRNAGEADLDSIQELEDICFSMPWTREQLFGQLPDEHHEFLVAVSTEGYIWGYIGMMTVLDEGYISNVAVSPEIRKRGIGRSLIRAMVNRGSERKLAFMTLEVRESNEEAKSLYSSEGFRVVGTRKNYYVSPTENALIMTFDYK